VHPGEWFRRPREYTLCLNCGRMIQNGSRDRCSTCNSTYVDVIRVSSPEQLDPLARPPARKWISKLAKLSGLPPGRVEQLIRRIQGRPPPRCQEPEGHIRVRYDDIRGLRMPIRLEEAEDNDLYWT
jgi:hypothetical protein